MKNPHKIIKVSLIICLLLLLFLSGCFHNRNTNSTFTFSTLNQCQNSYDELVINCSILERNYKEYVSTATHEIRECKGTIIEKDRLIYDVIRWNETIYNNTWNMSYPQTAKVTKISFWYVLGIMIAEFILGISIFVATEHKHKNRLKNIFLVILFLISAALIYYIISLRYS